MEAFAEENETDVLHHFFPDLDDEEIAVRPKTTTLYEDSYVEFDFSISPGRITLRETRAKGIGHQIWPAAVKLCTFIETNIGNYISVPSKTIVVELGSGIGLCGIFCSKLSCRSVILSDLPEVIEALNFNIDKNNASHNTIAKCIRWGVHEDLSSIAPLILDVKDNKLLILAADCIYWEHLFEPLYETICALVALGGTVLLSHVRRWKKDGRFFTICKKNPSLTVSKLQETVEMLPAEHTKIPTRHITRIYSISACK